jgi:D-3-phosphoglycerate dehydrogenase
MFGAEVADIAISYVLGTARQTYLINKGVRENQWPKPAGISLTHKKVGLIGFGDIGKAVAKRLYAFDMYLNIYDPFAIKSPEDELKYNFKTWPEEIEE